MNVLIGATLRFSMGHLSRHEKQSEQTLDANLVELLLVVT